MREDKGGGEDDAKTVSGTSTALQRPPVQRLKGKRVRDEFVCPITCEIMMEPVVASDGHSYENAAISKWMSVKDQSPRTGEPLNNKVLIANLNLKRVIQDMIAEGGTGLYMDDISNKGREFDILHQKILIMSCLGPPDSDWNQKHFQVTTFGCIGGRKIPDHLTKEFIPFRDTTVSRKHFEIDYDNERSMYQFRDLGSAGGSFIRIAFGKKKILHPGMILLIGKHQFTVSSVDTKKNFVSEACKPGSDEMGATKQSRTTSDFRSIVSQAESKATNNMADILSGAEEFMKMLTTSVSRASLNGDPNSSLLKVRLESLRGALMSASDSSSFKEALNFVADGKQDTPVVQYKDSPIAQEKETNIAAEQKVEEETNERFEDIILTLTCFAPDASPMQGRSFHVGATGATIGRKSQSTICMCLKASDDPLFASKNLIDGDKVLNIDSAVSTEHARIELDRETGEFYIMDGTSSKPSTNGTWYRLSGPHQESPYHDITPSMEVLIGTVRFQVSHTDTIAEKPVSS